MTNIQSTNPKERPNVRDLESTTLVTFLLNDVRKAHRVELFGSWDNFSTAYPMTKDSRRGRGHWRGIHTFKNIICDGDLSQENPFTQRDGALRIGGLYWYYYRLNGDVEYYNPSEPSTNNCPLLPGQTVNVLDVPLESSNQLSETLNMDPKSAMTWNPQDRWAPLKRKRTAPVTNMSKNNSTRSLQKPRFAKLRRLRTSNGEKAETITIPADGGAYSHSRPKSCPATVLSTETHKHPSSSKSKQSLPRPQSRGNTRSEDISSPGRNDTTELTADSHNPFHKPQRLSGATASIPEFLRTTRYLPSRARTAYGSSCPRTWAFGLCKLPPTEQEQRPSSAPSAFASLMASAECPELSDSEKIKNRTRSLRLRVACAKLRKLQNENQQGTVDNAWILDSLPNTFSGILQGFGSGEDTRENRQADNFDDLSASPPQLSFSSRQSTLWTPDTISILGTSQDNIGPSLRMSLRNSADFQVALQNAFDLDQSPTQHSEKVIDRLGVRFSSIGFDSQETIKPPRAHDAPVQPLDPAWNPFGNSSEQDSEESMVEQCSADKLLPNLGDTLNTNELMDDLGFLGRAIA